MRQSFYMPLELTEEILRPAHMLIPEGVYWVDAEALRQARQGIPAGEYHAR